MAEQVAIRVLTLGAWMLASPALHAQSTLHDELVSDGSFERHTRCPSGWTSIGKKLVILKDWEQPGQGTPDLLSRCSKNYESKIPFNYFGYQHPFDSASYVGVMNKKNGWREYIAQALSKPLVKDSTYRIELLVSLADNSRWASDSVGIGLSAGAPHSNTSGALECDTLLLSNGAITDTTNWVPLRFMYKASGTERHIVIGCFSSSNNGFVRTGRKRKPKRDWAYYYVDAVSVRMLSLGER